MNENVALVCIFILWLDGLLLVQSLVTKTMRATRSVPLMDVRKGKRLVDASIKTYMRPLESCALTCNKHPSCLSFNFCGRSTCELNNEDVFSTINSDQNLKADASCRYVGMAKLDRPMCKELGKYKHIQDDANAGTCAINGKRVDAEWGEWKVDEPSVDTSTVWKQFEKREIIIEPAHGGKTATGSSRRIYSWLQWVTKSKTWTQARDYCVQLGGELFSNVDGTKKQLDFFFDKLGQESHWLGIYTTDHVSWFSVNGSTIDKYLLCWDPIQAFNLENKQKHVASYILEKDGYKYLNDRNQGEMFWSICVLNV